MTTLLPSKNKKELKLDYKINFLVVLFWSLFVVSLIALILELTIYFSIKIEKDLLIGQVNSADFQKNDDLIKKYKEEVQKTQSLLSKFNIDQQLTSEVLNYIYSFNSKNISIETLSVNNREDGTYVNLSGTASNRESLLLFSKSLEKGEKTKELNLPLSSFVKNESIPFSLTFKYIPNDKK